MGNQLCELAETTNVGGMFGTPRTIARIWVEDSDELLQAQQDPRLGAYGTGRAEPRWLY
jgi:hypothetical protein